MLPALPAANKDARYANLKDPDFLLKVFVFGGAFGITCTRKMMLNDPMDDRYALIGIIATLAWDIFHYKLSSAKSFDLIGCFYRLCGASVMSVASKAAYMSPHVLIAACTASGAMVLADRTFALTYKRIHGLKESTAARLLSEKTLQQWIYGSAALSTVGFVSIDIVGEQQAKYVGLAIVLLITEMLREKRALPTAHPSVLSTRSFKTIAKIPFALLLSVVAFYYLFAKMIGSAYHYHTNRKRETK